MYLVYISLFAFILAFTNLSVESLECTICSAKQCDRCIVGCPKGQVLIKSPFGCCDDQCVSTEEPCKFPSRPCFKCNWCCAEGERLLASPCGCCYNKCIKDDTNVNTTTAKSTTPGFVCPPDYCLYTRCGAIPTCPAGQIVVRGIKMCGCCPGCVQPNVGDPCYIDFNNLSYTCGSFLTCFNGVCVT